jgi:hypothetical protein
LAGENIRNPLHATPWRARKECEEATEPYPRPYPHEHTTHIISQPNPIPEEAARCRHLALRARPPACRSPPVLVRRVHPGSHARPCGAPGTRPPRSHARLAERLAELYEVKDPSCIYNLEASSSSSPSTGSSGYAVLAWPPM